MSAEKTITCDQAVFTSIRTPTGQGYRIVAATPAVRADEKAEIINHSPSHNGLYDRGTDSVGLITYGLSSGRRCVGFVCFAGTEQSGRGGQRVYTHMALLDKAAYRSFRSDPVAVHAAIGEHVRASGPMLKPPPSIGPLTLTLPDVPSLSVPQARDWMGPAAADLIEGRRLVLTEEQSPIAFLQLVLMSLPRNLREQVNASADVRFSPSRGMHLVMLGNADPQLARQVAGQDLRVSAVKTAPPALPVHLKAWFGLIDRWYGEGRFADIVQLTSETCPDATADSLERIAAICEDMESLSSGNLEVIEAISRKHSGGGRTPAEQALLAALEERVQHRREQLQQPVDVA
jgi:hypothetical protein